MPDLRHHSHLLFAKMLNVLYTVLETNISTIHYIVDIDRLFNKIGALFIYAANHDWLSRTSVALVIF